VTKKQGALAVTSRCTTPGFYTSPALHFDQIGQANLAEVQHTSRGGVVGIDRIGPRSERHQVVPEALSVSPPHTLYQPARTSADGLNHAVSDLRELSDRALHA